MRSLKTHPRAAMLTAQFVLSPMDLDKLEFAIWVGTELLDR